MGRIRLGGELRDERINILVNRRTKNDLVKIANGKALLCKSNYQRSSQLPLARAQ